jgi:hypothetical protein
MNLLASIAVAFALLQVAPPPVPATFTGVFRGVESGRVVIEVENGQNMQMFTTSSTKFIRDGKPSKASQFHDGDAVTVDAERDARMNLVALRVEAIAPKSSKPATRTNQEKPGEEKPN